MRKPNARGILFDGMLAARKVLGLVLSGTIFRDAALRRRVLKKARWLSFKHLGIEQIVLPLRGSMQLCVNTADDVVACDVYLDGHFCYGEFESALHHIEHLRPWGCEPVVFVDVGANIGTHSLYALETGQFCRVVSVEPEAGNFALLVQNLRINGFAASDALNVGLSSKVGAGLLSVSRDNFGDHRLVTDAPAAGPRSQSSLTPVTLIDFASLRQSLHLPLDANILFWIDTQGHEYEVLSGIGAEMLSRSVVVTEFWPSLLRKNGTLASFMELAGSVISQFVVLQDRGSGFSDIGALAALSAHLLRQPYPADQVDLLCIGSRLALRDGPSAAGDSRGIR